MLENALLHPSPLFSNGEQVSASGQSCLYAVAVSCLEGCGRCVQPCRITASTCVLGTKKSPGAHGKQQFMAPFFTFFRCLASVSTSRRRFRAVWGFKANPMANDVGSKKPAACRFKDRQERLLLPSYLSSFLVTSVPVFLLVAIKRTALKPCEQVYSMAGIVLRQEAVR